VQHNKNKKQVSQERRPPYALTNLYDIPLRSSDMRDEEWLHCDQVQVRREAYAPARWMQDVNESDRAVQALIDNK